MKRKVFLLFIVLFSIANIKAFASISLQTDSVKPYTVINKSGNIEGVLISKKKKGDNKIFLMVGSREIKNKNEHAASLGISGTTESQERKDQTGPIFDKIDILSGNYSDISVVKQTTTQNLYTLKDVVFPLHLKMRDGKNFIEFEIKEKGTWDINVIYKNN
ncbi:hypothetical protein [Pedobacter sp.]|uniref:hypothetical protein n=1 Tax=Pedobacter sp. TaxID=1411316 RepID=UPI00396CFA15